MMVSIEGNAKKIKKGDYRCPDDGIHRKKDSGRIRGFWGIKIANQHIYYGNWAYYFRCSEKSEIGIKVFYSFKFGRTSKKSHEAYDTVAMMKQLADFCPGIICVDEVCTDIRINNKKHKAHSPAIYMNHVFFPEKAWCDFARGKPYDWKADDHPAHSKEGFVSFRNSLEKATEKINYNFDSFSIGNIVWCTVKKRWYLVDVR